LLSLATQAAVRLADPTNYRETLRTLQPGDELRLAPGDYPAGLPVHFLNGTPDAPIVIRGPANGTVARLVAQPGRNTVSLRDSSYVTIRGLTLDGGGIPVDAVKGEGDAAWAHHITLEKLRIIGHGANQQIVGISTKCPAWNWIIRGNVIEGAGTGMYFGDSDGGKPFVAGLIEHNLITRSLGYNLQIKHQLTRPEVPGMPATPQVTIIRHNVFAKDSSSAQGDLARPNVLVGHWPLRGMGRQDRYLVYGNFFYQNPAESLFQGEGRIALYHNLMVNDAGDALRLQPHHDRPRDIQIYFNTIVARTAGITVLRRGEDPEPVLQVTGNVVLAAHPITGFAPGDNLIDAYGAARDLLLETRRTPPALDLQLKQTIPLPLESLPARAHRLPDFGKDFAGHPRQAGIPGAYGQAGTEGAAGAWPPSFTRQFEHL
jgi:hypothetical protein